LAENLPNNNLGGYTPGHACPDKSGGSVIKMGGPRKMKKKNRTTVPFAQSYNMLQVIKSLLKERNYA
jgi:hypothetical protein